MAPTTRSMAHQMPPTSPDHHDDSDSSSDPDSDSGNSAFEDDDSDTVRSPTKLTYSLDKLSDNFKTTVRDTFNDPPKIALQRCRRINDTYAFQMTELVTRSIRIRAPSSSDASSRFSCSCRQDGNEPCTHLVWLLDQILEQTLYKREHHESLTMTASGFAEEMGDPFDSVANYHLDVLADGLHCQLVDPEADSDDNLDTQRILEARELLSAVYHVSPEDYRSDVFTSPRMGKKILKRNDLDYTIFRMLLDNHHFFQYFLSVSRSSDPINDPFRKLSQRVDHVMRDLDSYSTDPAHSSPPSSSAVSQPSTGGLAESPRNVAWAATHLVGCVQLIRSSIYNRERPLELRESVSAARALVHILSVVVSRNRDAHPGATRQDRNLYLRLIGDSSDDFVLRELSLLPEAASQFRHSLEDILDQLGVYGASPSYIDKFRNLLARLRTSTAGTSLKRPVQGETTGRGSKRMK
ncbi:hypothetical protein S7711_05293 [Stachybotrys chartarum IBT 7711]|uniref:SWIM-type domain-containing protein n=1 Tax=Stachybotrys chartarum (strain CBS 109288 / IBT 7711) TaxID=1280523 RepID=A0A084ALE2_STACB|nr:hypothetical protein S7711_05293 [Stachybotrys chartarum IBT 7711]KFA50833.1 hypothetical protein S40293_05801 [Stachybotrys chartarum IBT 40293]KFA73347.1 hypothetical protein S40288_03884 [Stachybotrys chartarum IBT 40288]